MPATPRTNARTKGRLVAAVGSVSSPASWNGLLLPREIPLQCRLLYGCCYNSGAYYKSSLTAQTFRRTLVLRSSFRPSMTMMPQRIMSSSGRGYTILLETKGLCCTFGESWHYWRCIVHTFITTQRHYHLLTASRNQSYLRNHLPFNRHFILKKLIQNAMRTWKWCLVLSKKWLSLNVNGRVHPSRTKDGWMSLKQVGPFPKELRGPWREDQNPIAEVQCQLWVCMHRFFIDLGWFRRNQQGAHRSKIACTTASTQLRHVYLSIRNSQGNQRRSECSASSFACASTGCCGRRTVFWWEGGDIAWKWNFVVPHIRSAVRCAKFLKISRKNNAGDRLCGKFRLKEIARSLKSDVKYRSLWMKQMPTTLRWDSRERCPR